MSRTELTKSTIKGRPLGRAKLRSCQKAEDLGKRRHQEQVSDVLRRQLDRQ